MRLESRRPPGMNETVYTFIVPDEVLLNASLSKHEMAILRGGDVAGGLRVMESIVREEERRIAWNTRKEGEDV